MVYSFFFRPSFSKTCILRNPLPDNPNFTDSEKRVIMNTLWEKEKMLVNSIFSCSHNGFYFIKDNKLFR